MGQHNIVRHVPRNVQSILITRWSSLTDLNYYDNEVLHKQVK